MHEKDPLYFVGCKAVTRAEQTHGHDSTLRPEWAEGKRYSLTNFNVESIVLHNLDLLILVYCSVAMNTQWDYT